MLPQTPPSSLFDVVQVRAGAAERLRCFSDWDAAQGFVAQHAQDLGPAIIMEQIEVFVCERLPEQQPQEGIIRLHAAPIVKTQTWLKACMAAGIQVPRGAVADAPETLQAFLQRSGATFTP